MSEIEQKEFDKLKDQCLLVIENSISSGIAPLELINAIKTPMAKHNIASQMAKSIQTQGGTPENALAHVVEYLREN